MAVLARLALLSLWLCAGCSAREDLDGKRRLPEGSQAPADRPQGSPPSLPVAPTMVDLHASRPMLLGYRRGALVIDAGSAAFSKFIDGGIRKDWHRRLQFSDSSGEKRPASAVNGLAAEIFFPLDSDPGGVALTGGNLDIRFTALSAVNDQLVSVFLNEQKLGDLRMPTTQWQNYAMSAPASALRMGENKLRFYFRSTATMGEFKSAAAFSRFSIGGSLSDEDAFVNAQRNAGTDRRPALSVSAASRISAFVLVPDKTSQLLLGLTGQGKASVRVRATDENKSVQRWSQMANQDAWAEAAIDLGKYQGQIIRLDLLSEEDMAWSTLKITGNAPEAPAAEIPVPDHIILWSVSSLRSDRLRGEAGRVFGRFAERGYNIGGAQSNVPAAGGAHATGMTGRMRVSSSIPESYTTLAERLQEAGYATALISGNGFVTDTAGYGQGFDFYDNPMRRQHHFGAKTLWRQASRFLQKHKEQRSFVHVVTVEAHVPYRPSEAALAKEWLLPAPFSMAKLLSLPDQIAKGRRVITANEQAYVRALYDASVSDAGAAFASMLEELHQLGIADKTAVILSGDHGEEMWERNTFGHGASLHQESLRTPLVILAPGLEGRRPPALASSIDLMPTILDMAGLRPGAKLQGNSLLGSGPKLDTRPQMAAASDGGRALRWGHYKLIYHPSGSVQLYDLQSDPGEQNDLSESRPVASRALRNVLATSIAYEAVWSTLRWGQVSSPTEAFARDQGM